MWFQYPASSEITGRGIPRTPRKERPSFPLFCVCYGGRWKAGISTLTAYVYPALPAPPDINFSLPPPVEVDSLRLLSSVSFFSFLISVIYVSCCIFDSPLCSSNFVLISEIFFPFYFLSSASSWSLFPSVGHLLSYFCFCVFLHWGDCSIFFSFMPEWFGYNFHPLC